MPYKVDFHTHSYASPDGSLEAEDYRRMLDQGLLDYIAVTDHNTIEAAIELHQELGDQIIVGEEITTTAGEIVGLYLTEVVPAMLSPEETVKLIHKQGGLVYIPHPFETVRKGVSAETLKALIGGIDIIEVRNGRAVFQDRGKDAEAWAKRNRIPGAAGSDSHGRAGWGKTFTALSGLPTKDNLKELLKNASLHRKRAGIRGMLYPKFNRLRKKGRR